MHLYDLIPKDISKRKKATQESRISKNVSVEKKSMVESGVHVEGGDHVKLYLIFWRCRGHNIEANAI